MERDSHASRLGKVSRIRADTFLLQVRLKYKAGLFVTDLNSSKSTINASGSVA
jgi:hypothetical protein